VENDRHFILNLVCVSVDTFSRNIYIFVGTNIVLGKFVDKINTRTLFPVQF